MQNDDKQTLPQLFIGVFPCGISYSDRHHEEHGDFKSLAFLPYSSLVLEFRKDCPAELRSEIIARANSTKSQVAARTFCSVVKNGHERTNCVAYFWRLTPHENGECSLTKHSPSSMVCWQ